MKTLTAFYDLEFGPVSFDFVTWLVRAMLERDRRKCDRLHVVVVPKEDGVGGFSRNWGGHDEHSARWRLWHIVAAVCPLAGATLTIAPTRDFAKNQIVALEAHWWWPQGKAHFTRPLIEASRAGERVPTLRASEGARRFGSTARKNLVTLTLRQQAHDTARNSQRAEWGRMAQWLVFGGYEVVLLDDSNSALGLPSGPFAALDPDLRLALYESACMNLVGNNGPAVLLWHSSAPFIYVSAGLPADPYRAHWEKHMALRTGDQLPWARADQRLVYRPDTFEVMREEFLRLQPVEAACA